MPRQDLWVGHVTRVKMKIHTFVSRQYVEMYMKNALTGTAAI